MGLTVEHLSHTTSTSLAAKKSSTKSSRKSQRETAFGPHFRAPEIVRTTTPDLVESKRSDYYVRVIGQIAECGAEQGLEEAQARLGSHLDAAAALLAEAEGAPAEDAPAEAPAAAPIDAALPEPRSTKHGLTALNEATGALAAAVERLQEAKLRLEQAKLNAAAASSEAPAQGKGKGKGKKALETPSVNPALEAAVTAATAAADAAVQPVRSAHAAALGWRGWGERAASRLRETRSALEGRRANVMRADAMNREARRLAAMYAHEESSMASALWFHVDYLAQCDAEAARQAARRRSAVRHAKNGGHVDHARDFSHRAVGTRFFSPPYSLDGPMSPPPPPPPPRASPSSMRGSASLPELGGHGGHGGHGRSIASGATSFGASAAPAASTLGRGPTPPGGVGGVSFPSLLVGGSHAGGSPGKRVRIYSRQGSRQGGMLSSRGSPGGGSRGSGRLPSRGLEQLGSAGSMGGTGSAGSMDGGGMGGSGMARGAAASLGRGPPTMASTASSRRSLPPSHRRPRSVEREALEQEVMLLPD